MKKKRWLLPMTNETVFLSFALSLPSASTSKYCNVFVYFAIATHMNFSVRWSSGIATIVIIIKAQMKKWPISTTLACVASKKTYLVTVFLADHGIPKQKKERNNVEKEQKHI